MIVVRHVSSIPQTRGWERKIAEGPPCVVLASPGFVTVGPSRELLELWAPDSRNGIIVTGYSVEGTMARVSHCSMNLFSQVWWYTKIVQIVLYVYSSEAIHNVHPSRCDVISL